MPDLAKLAAAVAERAASAYVLTVSDEGSAHATYSPVRWESGRFVAEVGKRTARNARARPRVSLLFPVRSPDDYSLIVDGAATVDLERLTLVVIPSRAILHRHGPGSQPGAVCSDDCLVLLAATASSSA
jgi:hypothetical protein